MARFGPYITRSNARIAGAIGQCNEIVPVDDNRARNVFLEEVVSDDTAEKLLYLHTNF